MQIGYALTGIGGLGIITATIYYIRDSRPANYDVMGTAIMFDDVMLPSLFVLSIGITVVQGLHWWWILILFAALYFIIGMGYRFMLVYLLDWFRRQ